MFKTTGVIDRAFYNEMKRHMIPPKNKITIIVMTVAAALYSLWTFILQKYMLTLLFAVMALVMVLEYFLLRNKVIKTNLKQTVETVGKDEITYTVCFAEDGVLVENHDTNANAKMGYENFVRLVKCKSAYVLVTKANQFVPIFVELLTDAEKKDLADFLKSHAPHLRIK